MHHSSRTQCPLSLIPPLLLVYRELACALLSKDFGLEVVLPEDRLVPMVPQRLNYIHWLEDLLVEGEERERAEGKKVLGVDIGECRSAISVADVRSRNRFGKRTKLTLQCNLSNQGCKKVEGSMHAMNCSWRKKSVVRSRFHFSELVWPSLAKLELHAYCTLVEGCDLQVRGPHVSTHCWGRR